MSIEIITRKFYYPSGKLNMEEQGYYSHNGFFERHGWIREYSRYGLLLTEFYIHNGWSVGREIWRYSTGTIYVDRFWLI